MTNKFVGHFSTQPLQRSDEYKHIIEKIENTTDINNIELVINNFINKNKIEYLKDYGDLRKRACVFLEYIYLPLNLHLKQNIKVLDIGSGFCTIKMISDALHHECINIEKPYKNKNSDLFLFKEVNSLLNCSTIYKDIVYTTKLNFENKFDVIFLLSQSFDEVGEKKLWTSSQWMYFLRNLKACLNTDGKIILLYNSKTYNSRFNIIAEENLKVLNDRAHEFNLYIV